MRVARFFVSCLAPTPPPLPPPHRPPYLLLRCLLNRKCRMAVFPARPQPRAPDGSVPRRTSTASSRRQWQCSPAERQPPAPDGSVLRRASTASFGWQCSRRTSTASLPRRTSTMRFGWQCSPPDLYRELRLAVFPARHQPRVRIYARKNATMNDKRDARKNVKKNVRRCARKNAEIMIQHMPENLSGRNVMVGITRSICLGRRQMYRKAKKPSKLLKGSAEPFLFGAWFDA